MQSTAYLETSGIYKKKCDNSRRNSEGIINSEDGIEISLAWIFTTRKHSNKRAV